GDLPFRDAWQHDDDAVALADATLAKCGRQPVRQPGHVGEGEALLLARLVAPDQGQLVGIAGKAVDDVRAEVERCWYVPAERLVQAGVAVRHGVLLPNTGLRARP